jgi:hypothetical protein
MARAAPPAMTPVHPSGAGGAQHGVDDGRAGEGDVEEVLARLLDALLHRQTRLLRLAVAEAHAALAVADDHERGEREPPSALHDLRHAVHLDGALFVLLYVGH